MARASSRREMISQACDLIEEWTGFALRETAPRRIAETFDERSRRLGYDHPLDYLEELRHLPPTADEPQRLVNLITNGLTAFWRDKPQLSALRSLLNHLYDPHYALGPVYVWCAGVSTGEEAYTVAILADEEDVDVHVLGTDINTDFLATAQSGTYDEWSLRRMPPSRRDTYLRRIDDRRWTTDHSAFDDVHFKHHNLLSPPPSSPHPDGRWDIVLCRNVLIYFSQKATSRALRNMTDQLADEGYLIFGSSEQLHPEDLGPDAPHLRPIRRGGGFVYRPGRRRTGATIEPGHWPHESGDPFPALPPIEDRTRRADSPDFSTLADVSTLAETTSNVDDGATVAELLRTAAEHIDDGDLELAAHCLEAALGYDPFHVESHCLMGTILHSLGATERAAEAFQKALFLVPDHWYAAHRTAIIHEARGDIASARRAFRRTLRGLEISPDPLDATSVLRHIAGQSFRLRRQAKRQAHAFLQLHDNAS